MSDAEYFENLYKETTDPWKRELRASLRMYEERYLRILRQNVPTAERILEVACGTGYFSIQLVEAYPSAEVCGCDISPTAVNVAQNRHGRQARFFVSKMPEIEGAIDRYDLIVLNEALAYLDEPGRRAALERLRALTKADGHLFISSNVGARYFDVEGLAQLLGSCYGKVVCSVPNYAKPYYHLVEVPLLGMLDRCQRAAHVYWLLAPIFLVVATVCRGLIGSRFLFELAQSLSSRLLGDSAVSHVYFLVVNARE